MADQQEILNTILLTRLNYFSLAGMLELYRRTGSATLIMEHRNDIRSLLPDASDKLVNALKNCDEARKRAEVELEYDIRYGIEPITMNDDRYPQRLKDCDDAPLMLFYKGNANLNQQRVINIIGTRHCTPYGEDLIRRFISELKQLSPRVLIVSGLAYGVDIMAHRQALACGYETVGVLAHGLSMQMGIKTVASEDEALDHIATYGSGHSESIVSNNEAAQKKFQALVDAACVYVNAPTSFTDGAQFGLGAEIGISTQKLGARGPMALEEITTYKWLITGNGQTRK